MSKAFSKQLAVLMRFTERAMSSSFRRAPCTKPSTQKNLAKKKCLGIFIKNVMPTQIVRSTHKIYQEGFPKAVFLNNSTKGVGEGGGGV